ncbi:MAG: DUF2339 domain-containing protein [Clostridiales bacterium]|nr:DUF2339 domain-containing protein [Clostridiales bacterium]
MSELEAELRALEGSSLAKENAELKAELERIRADLGAAHGDAQRLTAENSGLRTALYEQIYNDKVGIVNATANKLEIYFSSGVAGEMNRLSALEYSIRNRIDYIRNTLTYYSIDIHDNIYTRLDELQYWLDVRVTEARAAAMRTSGAFSEEERAAFEALKNEQLTDEQIREVTKKNNVERFLGLNVFNAVGILLLVIGAIAFARFAFVFLPDVLKGVMLFALGGALLTAGELQNRRKPGVFSLGLTAGGIGILYAAMVTAFFVLDILGAYSTAAICLLITAGAFVLATRYNSQIIAVFALIGGYLPIFALDALTSSGSDGMLYGAMAYFVALNLFALLISFRKKWRLTAFIGLFLNIFGTFFICIILLPEPGNTLKCALAIVYVLFAFLIYTAIPIASNYRARLKFSASDIALLSINTIFSCAMMYGVFAGFRLEGYYGLLALIFAVIYFAIGRLVGVRFEGRAPGVKALFYITGLAFIVLFVPLQFGEMWLTLGWLVEGVLLAVYGITKNEKRFMIAGFTICVLCLMAFFTYDLANADHYLFPYKYLAATLGSIAILGAYIHRKTMHEVKAYKYVVMVNLWVFIIYLILAQLQKTLFKAYGSGVLFDLEYIMLATVIVVTFAFAFGYMRIRFLLDSGARLISAVLYLIGIIALLVANGAMHPVAYRFLAPSGYLTGGALGRGEAFAAAAVLAVVAFLSVMALRDLMRMAAAERKIGVEWYPLAVSGYIVIILTQILIAQYGLEFSSAAISIIYGLTALAWIVFGFVYRYSFVRKFGLGLAMFSVVKLFLVDLYGLAEGYRIISYFALGATLIAISFGYQYFSKRLELTDAAVAPVGEDPEKVVES